MRSVLVIIILACALLSQAQNPAIIKADNLVAAGKPDKALAFLEKSYSKSGEREIGIHIIDLHAEMRQFKKALLWAEKLSITECSNEADLLLYTGLLIREHRFREARNACIRFAHNHDNIGAAYDRAYEAEDLIKAQYHDYLYKINTVPFNSRYDDVAIANFRRHYVITSNRVAEYGENTTGDDYFDVFLLTQDYDKWRIPVYLLKDAGHKVNRTTICYTIDGNRVFYSTYEYTSPKSRRKNAGVQPIFSISEATGLGNMWVDPQTLPFNKGGRSVKDPAISPDGKMLVFAGREATREDFDLYYSVLNADNTWSEPLLLSDNVNSASNDVMPYFSEEGNLYFSSDRFPGFGGYDIYSCRNDNGNWTLPRILPPPLNSSYDDMSLIFHYGRPGGYIVSNRLGGQGGYDIYAFSEMNISLSVSAVDKKSGITVPSAGISLYRDSILLDQDRTDEKGNVVFKVGPDVSYMIKAEKTGYENWERNLSTGSKKDGDIIYVNAPLNQMAETSVIDNTNHQTDPGYITFTATIVDGNGSALPFCPVRFINETSGRMKILTSNDQGSFSQLLLTGNKYKVIIDHDGNSYVRYVSTAEPGGNKDITVLYTIDPNKD